MGGAPESGKRDRQLEFILLEEAALDKAIEDTRQRHALGEISDAALLRAEERYRKNIKALSIARSEFSRNLH